MFSVDRDLPELLGAALDYLATHLPSPVYSLLIALISRLLAVLYQLLTLVASLTRTTPFDWNFQDILPPLVTLFCAYLALLTIYRTATWAIKTVFWFFKWGLILSIIFTGMGWYLHDAAGGGVAANIQSVFDTINTRISETAGGMQSARISQTHSSSGNPRVWDSFESHRRRREASQPYANNEVDIDRVIKSVVDMAGGLLEQGGQLWQVAKSIVSEVQLSSDPKGQREQNSGPSSRSR